MAAFSLVEILVVLAVIAVLATILIPSVTRVRLSSLQAKDTSQLRSIGTAVKAFATENGGVLPQYNYPVQNIHGPNADWRSPVRALFAADKRNLGGPHPLGNGDYLDSIDVLYSPLLLNMQDRKKDGRFYTNDTGFPIMGYYLYSSPSNVDVNSRNPVVYKGQLYSNETIHDWGRTPIYSDYVGNYADTYGFQGNKFFVLHLDGSISVRDAATANRVYRTSQSMFYHYMATGKVE